MNNLSILIYKDGNLWLAQGLEHNILSHGKDFYNAFYNFLDTVDKEREACKHFGTVFEEIKPARQEFWDRAKNALEIDPSDIDKNFNPEKSLDILQLHIEKIKNSKELMLA